MTRRQFQVMLVAVVVSGLVGGMLSDRLLRSGVTPAKAEIVLGPRPEPGKETLAVQRLLIQDEEGNTWGSLSPWGLHLRDPKSAASLGLLLGDGDTVLPQLTLTNGEEPLGTVSASVSPKGFASLMLQQQGGPCLQCQAGESGATMALQSTDNPWALRLNVQKDGDALISLEEADGQGSTVLRRLIDGTAGLEISDANGNNRVSVGLPSHGGATMRLRGDNRETVWSAP